MTKTKRAFAYFLLLCGSLICFITLAWIVSYFIERGFTLADLKASFTSEFLWWAPVGVLGIPGIIMIHKARRLLKEGNISASSVGEVAILFAIMGILGAMVYPPDNFSFIAASIITDGVKAVEEVQRDIEEHHSLYGHFPNSTDDLEFDLPNPDEFKHIQSLSVGQSGRIIITYDTRDIDWHYKWWHRLFLLENNDLTDKTLILVPLVNGNTITWDECNEGTVPQHNRHFKCSGHM
ncbi:MAG: hypothetical protein HND53_02105 [Proteobacteria bacterium]|nr:hypothetical protein [Pseudomonadota bacterium]NOG59263.1 hypothetical protein [Pseudomonadota bacterium]